MTGWDPEKITFFAKTDARGQNVPFGIKAKDRQRHMYVIGKTGMGKSTLLENMAAQDIQSGEGMAFIDPHGSAIETLLEYVPEDRLDDVVYFAPFDMENPISFNIMEDVGIDKRHLVVSGLMSTFKKIWVDAWSARMEYILTNALLALIEYPDTTLLSVNRMLADKVYRDKVVDHIKDPAVKAYWVDEFASYTERFAAEALPAIQNKIGQFTGNPLIRNIIGQPHSSFDVRKMMDEKKILLINLSKGLVGETNADLLGSMLITKIYLAAMSRADQSPAQMKLMPNFYFYVDEFQSFANSTFANILSEARKYHLNLIIAHQYVEQMEEEVRNAVFGNVGTTITFRVGPFDAEVLETIFAPRFEAVNLVNLGFAQIYLSLMIDGVGSQPFSAVTLPPVAPPPKSHKYMVIKRSQQHYTKPRAEVEQAVIDSHSPDKRIADAVASGGGNKGGFAKPSAFFKVGSEKKGNGGKKPQTGNGNNNGNGNNAGNGTRATNQSDRPAPQRPAAKTPDDLRSILAGMAGAQTDAKKPAQQPTVAPESKTPQAEPKPTTPPPTKPTEKPVEKPARPDAAVNANNTRAPQAQTPPANKQFDRPRPDKSVSRPAAQTPDDLRAVLAKMTGQLTVQTTPKKDTPQPTAKPAAQQQSKPQPSPQQPKTNTSLQSALADVLTKVDSAPAVPAPQTPTPVPVVQKSEEKVASQPTTPKHAPVSQAKPVEPSVGAVRRLAFEPHTQVTAPDIATVKKMLQTSGKERPPGS